MMPPSKQFDPVLGIDIHITATPPAPPIPIPHPFVGLVLDIMEFVPVLGATVKAHGIPAAIAGIECKCLPKHIPLGGPFVGPPPGSEGELFMGSSTVSIDGDAASYMALPAITCHSVGMPKPPRMNPKKKPKPKVDMMLPLSFVLPIPGGRPVEIGGSPTISLMALGMKLAMAGLGKAFQKFKKWQKGSKLMKKISDAIHSKADNLMKKLGIPPNVRNKMHKAICSLTGHPVDVATGKVLTDHVDFELPGPLPFTWERTWYSTSVYNGPLGHGWHHSYDLRLAEENGAVAVILDDGRPIAFPALDAGEVSFNAQERITLLRDEDGYGLRNASGTTYRFTPFDGDTTHQLLSSMIDRSTGKRIRFSYSSKGYLREIIDSAGRKITIQNNAEGRIEKIVLPNPDANKPDQPFMVVRYAYDKHGDLVEVKNAPGHPIRYCYENHLLVQETNRNGLSFYFQYDGTDENARCIRTWGDGGIYDHKLTYDLVNNITVVENSLGHTTTYYHDGALPLTIVDARGGETRFVYDDYYRKISEKDPLGNETVYRYDELGNIVAKIDPDGTREQITYNSGCLPTRAVDKMGGEWQWEYDDAFRITKRIDPLGQATTFTYDGAFLATIEDPAGSITAVSIDEQGNLKKVTNSDSTNVAWEYDSLGQRLTEIDPNENRREFRYDIGGRVYRLDEPDGNHVSFDYDPEGNVVRAKDNQYDVSFTYGGKNKLISRFQNGTKVDFKYDTEERLLEIHNEYGSVYSYTLDECGDVRTESGFDGIRLTYERDIGGRVVRLRRPGERTTEYTYDPMKRVTKIVHSNGSSETFAYQDDGEMVTATNSTCTIRFERDPLGRVIEEWQNNYQVSSEYDKQGNRIRIHSSLGADQKIKRTSMGDTESITFQDERNPSDTPWKTTFTCDRLGLEVQREMSGGLTNRWERDRLGRPVAHQIHSAAGYNRTRHYQWDIYNRLKSIDDSLTGTTIFHHDPFGNLAKATMPDGSTIFRMPDVIGNLFRTENRSDRKYGPAGQLLEAETKRGSVKYEYDVEGNLVKKSESGGHVWHYFWNGSGMLEKVIRPDNEEVVFTYDALGRRLSKSYKGRTTRWVWDGNVPLHEWIEDASMLVQSSSEAERTDSDEILNQFIQRQLSGRHTNAPPRQIGTSQQPITWIFEPESFALLAEIIDNKYNNIVTDHLGTPLAMFDVNGNTTWSMELDIYGQVRTMEENGAYCPFRYPGQYEDEETGLYYNRFRYYDPESGVYVSQDPIGLGGKGVNIYGYVKDPALLIDILGLMPWANFHNGALATISNGSVAEEFESVSKVAHAEIRGLRDFADRGLLQNMDIVISDVTGKFRRDSSKIIDLLPTGVCSKCRRDMFEILQTGGAKSITIPRIINGNIIEYKILSNKFADVGKELTDELSKIPLKNKIGRSNKAWEIIQRYDVGVCE